MNNQAKLFKIENYFEPFDRDCVLRAKEVFDDYFEKGIILRVKKTSIFQQVKFAVLK